MSKSFDETKRAAMRYKSHADKLSTAIMLWVDEMKSLPAYTPFGLGDSDGCQVRLDRLDGAWQLLVVGPHDDAEPEPRPIVIQHAPIHLKAAALRMRAKFMLQLKLQFEYLYREMQSAFDKSGIEWPAEELSE